MILAKSLNKCLSSKEADCLKKELQKIKYKSKLGGIVKFNQYGDIKPSFSAHIIKNSEYIFVN